MLYKQLIELFDILDSASASGAQVVEYFRSIVPDCQVETYPLEGPKGHTDMVRILIPGRNGKSKGGSAKTMGILGRLGGLGARPEQLGFVYGLAWRDRSSSRCCGLCIRRRWCPGCSFRGSKASGYAEKG